MPAAADHVRDLVDAVLAGRGCDGQVADLGRLPRLKRVGVAESRLAGPLDDWPGDQQGHVLAGVAAESFEVAVVGFGIAAAIGNFTAGLLADKWPTRSLLLGLTALSAVLLSDDLYRGDPRRRSRQPCSRGRTRVRHRAPFCRPTPPPQPRTFPRSTAHSRSAHSTSASRETPSPEDASSRASESTRSPGPAPHWPLPRRF
jgi:hypothetical protein